MDIDLLKSFEKISYIDNDTALNSAETANTQNSDSIFASQDNVGNCNGLSIFTSNKPEDKTKNNTPSQIDYNNTSDGIIQDTKQGEEGTCWAEAQIHCVSETSWGKKIINESINKTPDGYQVSFKGVGKTINLSNEEIEEFTKTNKTTGDIDVNILEAATAKHFQEEINAGKLHRGGKDVLDGNTLVGDDSIQYLLTGKTGKGLTIYDINDDKYKDIRTKYPNIQDKYKNLYSQITKEKVSDILSKKANSLDDYAIICDLKEQKGLTKGLLNIIAPNWEFARKAEHAYYISNIEKNSDGKISNITLKNPWDTSNDITMSYNQFLKRVAEIGYTENPDN